MNLDLVYEIVYLFTMLITAWAASAIWHRRSGPGGLALFIMMLAILEWNFCGFMEVFSGSPAGNIFWSRIGYLGSWTAQPLFLIFVLGYTQHQKWVTPRKIALLFIMPVITILLVMTNDLHHQIWSGFIPSPEGHVTYLHGAWFWVSVVYINAVMLLGTTLLLRFIRHTRELYRYQNLWLLLASIFPWVGFGLYVSPINPLPSLDITAISFAATGAVLVYIIARLNFLDIVPVAREFLVDHMLDGLLMLDYHNRVVDINPAALKIFDLQPNSKWIGLPVSELLPTDSGLEIQLKGPDKLAIEWEQTGPEPRFYDIQLLPLSAQPNHLAGRLIILRDITPRKNIERALSQANRELEEKLLLIEGLKDELREQSIRDALTGLFNRRYIEEIFTREVARAQRSDSPLSVVIVDLDHFKEINDRYGHTCGDDLLRAMGIAFQTHFRGGDIACRYGGDEFMVIMPESAAADAFQRIESFRLLCNGMLQERSAGLPPVTFSAGVASYPAHAANTPELFRIADQTLYRAKNEGRNRTSLP